MPARPRIVAVDWSGARLANGVSVAVLEPGAAGPVLLSPPDGRRWRRADVLYLLCEAAIGRTPTVAGIDCAFALPRMGGGYLPGLGAKSAPALWQAVDAESWLADDFYAGPFVEAYAECFWRSGKRPSGFVERRRLTERRARELGFGTPQSPLKLIGSAQVGMAGLAGMRVLHALKERLGPRVRIWPFEPEAPGRPLTVVEIYPTLYRNQAGKGSRKVTTVEALEDALTVFEFTISDTLSDPLSDHDSDALIAAAGMAKTIAEPEAWAPAGLDSKTRATEGWIFGVA